MSDWTSLTKPEGPTPKYFAELSKNVSLPSLLWYARPEDVAHTKFLRPSVLGFLLTNYFIPQFFVTGIICSSLVKVWFLARISMFTCISAITSTLYNVSVFPTFSEMSPSTTYFKLFLKYLSLVIQQAV